MPLAPRWRSLTLPILAGISLAVSGCQNGDPPPDEDESRPPAPKQKRIEDAPSSETGFIPRDTFYPGREYILDRNTGRLTLAPQKDEHVGVTPGNGGSPVPYQGWPEPPPQKVGPEVGQKEQDHLYTIEVVENGMTYVVKMRPELGEKSFVSPPRPEPAPLKLTDQDRKDAGSDLATYLNNLSTATLVKRNEDEVTGTIVICNNGLRKIDAMEVTLLIPAGEEYKTIRYMLQDGSKNAPPQPKSKGSSVMFPAYIKVNEDPVPANGGKCEVKITYIKFAE